MVRPEKPLDFLITKLQQNPVRRVFFVSPPGCKRQEIAKAIAEHLDWKFISTSAAILSEGEKETNEGGEILKSTKKFEYVSDKIVIDLVAKEIQEAEKANKSWIVEGFPRTRAQALSFAKLGVVPDKIVQLSCPEEVSVEHIKESCRDINGKLSKK